MKNYTARSVDVEEKGERKESASVEETELAGRCVKRWETLNGKLTVWKPFFQELADFIQPRKRDMIVSKITTPTTYPEAALYDSTAVRANLTFARGMMNLMTPAGMPWFTFSAPSFLQDNDKVKQWFQECTEIAQDAIAASNFYTAELEDLLDYGAYGTSAMYCEEGNDTLLNFQNFSIGTYAIAENDECKVDTIYREYPMTPRQMRQKFGLESLSVEVQAFFAKDDDTRQDQPIRILHCIEPRWEYDPTKNDGANKPVSSVYLELKTKKVLRNSGFSEMPVMVSRYLKWGDEPYGWAPSWAVLPDAKQANYLEKHTDALAEVIAWPRLLVPDTHEGQIDIRASGVTYYSPQVGGAKPEEWLTGGRQEASIERIQAKRKAIEEAYFVDLFQMFSTQQRAITAYEASLLNGEKLSLLTATSSSRNTEHYNPLLHRVWGILIRSGSFPTIPDELIQRDVSGNAFIPDPLISYNSKIALAIKAVETNGWLELMQTQVPIWQIRPDLLDNFDIDEIQRDIARNNGMPASWLMDVDLRDKQREARAQQQAQAQQQAAQNMASETIKNASQAKALQAAA